MSRLWRTLAATVAAALLGVALTAGAAAGAVDPANPFRANAACQTNQVVLCDPEPASESTLLPVNRWSTATSTMHSRLSSNPLEDFAAKIQRNGTYPVLMSLGNSMWSGATGLTSAAIRMDVLGAAGQAADNAAATLGGSLISSGILALVAIAALVVPLWRAARGQGAGPWMPALKTVATVGLFVVMVNAAGASTTAGTTFKPGFLSPGWFVVTTNGIISSLASVPAAALTATDTGAGFAYDTTDPSSTGALSCAQYVSRLKADYTGSNPLNKVENSIPLVMSGLWEATGLQVWAGAQFGTANPYGSFSYCRLLEQQSGTSPATQRSVTLRSTTDPAAATSSLKSLAWETAENNQEDRTAVAWAECRPNGSGGWTLAPGWEKATADARNTTAPADCKSWWTNPADFNATSGTFADGQSAFNWDNAKQIVADSGDLRVKNYLLTLQGRTGGATASLAMVYSYVASALIILVVFGLIAGAIIVAKIAALVMMVATFFVLLMSLWPRTGKGSVGKFFGQYVGMSLFVFGIQLIFAFMTLITSMMVKAGNQMFGPGTIIAMIWTGFAPVVAIVVIHMIFTKFLKVPSPFSLSGAQQWGSAASRGAVGGAVGAGLVSSIQRHSGQALMRTGQRAGKAAVGVASNGRLAGRLGGRGGPARPGSIVPGGDQAASAAAAVGTPSAPAASAAGAVPAPAAAGTSVERKAQAAKTKAAADAAARARGATNTIVGRQVEGAKARMLNARDAFTNRPAGVGAQVAAGSRVAARGLVGAAKIAGAGALIVGTGGVAAPLVAAVWGKNHVTKGRTARAGRIDSFPARQAAEELAKKKAQERLGARAEAAPAMTIVQRRAARGDVDGRQVSGRAAAVVNAAATDHRPVDPDRGAPQRGVDGPPAARSNGVTVPARPRGSEWSEFAAGAKARAEAAPTQPARRTPRPPSGSAKRGARPGGNRRGERTFR